MIRTTIDMTRPTALYLSSAALLLLITFFLPRLPVPSIATLFAIPNSRAIAGALLCASIASGFAGAQRLAARAKAPWQVPLSQSAILFSLFFIFGLSALALSI